MIKLHNWNQSYGIKLIKIKNIVRTGDTDSLELRVLFPVVWSVAGGYSSN